MKLTINVKPQIITAHSKDALIAKIQDNRHSVFSSKYGHGFVEEYRNETKAMRVYNLHKVRAKYQQIKNKTGIDDTRKVSKKVRDAHWIAYVYDFKVGVLDALNLKVDQKQRNFILKKS